MAAFYIYPRRRRMGIDCKTLAEYLFFCSVFALIGARVLFAISMIPSMEKVTLNELLYYLWNGGIVFYGGLFGVISGIVVVSKKKHISIENMLNFSAPAFPLFHAFARLGCLLAGCCYGIEWNWGVILMDEPGVIRFPVQLFESICDLLIFAGLISLKNRKNTFKIYMCSYAVCRFLLEFFRGDEVRGKWAGGLSTSQYISAMILLFYIFVFVRKRKQLSKNVVEIAKTGI